MKFHCIILIDHTIPSDSISSSAVFKTMFINLFKFIFTPIYKPILTLILSTYTYSQIYTMFSNLDHFYEYVYRYVSICVYIIKFIYSLNILGIPQILFRIPLLFLCISPACKISPKYKFPFGRKARMGEER